MKVLICGGGNVVHVLAAYLSAKPDMNVTVLSLFPGEACKLRDAIPGEGIRCANELSYDILGKPDAIVDKAGDVPKDLDVVLFAVPSFVHELYLKALKPHLKPGVTIGALPGDGGFDFCVGHNLGSEFVRHSNLFALHTLPWTCRIIEYGKSVEVLGMEEEELDVMVSPKLGATKDGIVNDVLRDLVWGLRPPVAADDAFTLSQMCVNSIQHPPGRKATEPCELVVKSQQSPPEDSLSLQISLSDVDDLENIHTVPYTAKGYLRCSRLEEEARVGGNKKRWPNFKCRYFIDVPYRSRRRPKRCQAYSLNTLRGEYNPLVAGHGTTY